MRDMQPESPRHERRRHEPSATAVEQYLAEIRRYTALTRDEEALLARRIRERDRDALDTLVRANLRFVVAVARQYRHCGVPLEDLVSEGNIGLIRAAERFDGTRGVRFVSYAVWRIRQAILQAVDGQSRLIRRPAVARRRVVARVELSLDAPIGDEDDTVLGEVVADERAAPPDGQVTGAAAHQAIARALAGLAPRDAAIVRLHFGLDGAGPLTAEELGERLAMSPALVRRRLAAALVFLRRSAAARALAAVV